MGADSKYRNQLWLASQRGCDDGCQEPSCRIPFETLGAYEKFVMSGSHGFYNLGQEILIIHAMISRIPTISTIFMIILFIYLHWKVSVDNR